MALLSRRVLLSQLVVGGTGCATGSTGDDLDASEQEIEVAPSDDADLEIQAALDAGHAVALTEGTFHVRQPLTLGSGARLRGAGSGLTRIVADFSPSPDRADDRSNALLVIGGTTGELPGSTLAATAPKDSWSLLLAEPLSALEPGMWVRVSGPNSLEDEYEASDTAPLCELVSVSGVEGDVLLLDSATHQFHAQGVFVDIVLPAVDVEIDGLDLSAEGGTLAVGVALDLTVDVRLSDISGAGFSRALVDLGPGTRGARIDLLRSRGEVNAIVHADTSMNLHLETILTTPGGARFHQLGIPRGLLTFIHRCTGVVVTSCQLEGGCIGIRTWGGHHIHFSDIVIRDMDPTAALQRDPLIQGGVVGVGIDSGAGWLDHAEFGRDISFVNVHLENCRQPTETTQAAWYLHDIFGVAITGCSIVNKGASPSTAGFHMTGMLASDCSGSIDSLMVQGVNYALRTRNVMTDLSVSVLEVYGTSGYGLNGDVALHLDHGVVPGGRGPQIERLKLNNVNHYFLSGPDFARNPDWSMGVRTFFANGLEYDDCVVANSGDEPRFAIGEIADLEEAPGGGRRLVSPTGGSTRACVVASGWPYSSGQGFLLVSSFPNPRAHVLCTEAAVEIGDLLVSSAAFPRRAEVENSPTNPFEILGKALQAKPAGAEGLVLVGPA